MFDFPSCPKSEWPNSDGQLRGSQKGWRILLWGQLLGLQLQWVDSQPGRFALVKGSRRVAKKL